MTPVVRMLCATTLGLATVFGAGSAAQAAYIVRLTEVGSDVIAQGAGTIDLTGLTFITPGSTVPQMAPTFATEAAGASGGIDEYAGASGPLSFGPGVITNATTGTGDLVGIQNLTNGSGFVFVPMGYASGSALLDTATYAGQSFASLGVTPGTYVWSWGPAASDDTFTLDAVAAAAPEPGTLPLLGAGLGGLVMLLTLRRRSALPG